MFDINSRFQPFLENSDRFLLLYGGAGSGKSYFVAQKILTRMMTEKGHRIVLCRKVARTIRNSQYQLLKDIIRENGLTEKFKCADTRMEITCKENGNTIISTGVDDPEKLKSLAQPTMIWIEEATELDVRDFRQLNLRLRGVTHTYMQVVMTFNPTTKHSWLYKEFFAQKNERATIVHTTWKDNDHLDKDYGQELLDMKGRDDEYYQVYALGEWGEHTRELVYHYELTDTMPESDTEIYGLDFGYNNPYVLVKVALDKGNIYAEEVFYRQNITNSDAIPLLKKHVKTKHAEIYGDAAEPGRIEEIYREGFNIHPAKKDVLDGIDWVKRFKLNIVRGSTNLIRELDNYKWKQDKTGQLLDVPNKQDDHACDALRYAVFSHLTRKRKKILGIA